MTRDLFGEPQPPEPQADKLRPRQHAVRILELPEEQRRAALAEVPQHLRRWVAFYVRDWWHLWRQGRRPMVQRGTTDEGNK